MLVQLSVCESVWTKHKGVSDECRRNPQKDYIAQLRFIYIDVKAKATSLPDRSIEKPI